MIDTEPEAEPEAANVFRISIRKARGKRVTGWAAVCHSCGVINRAVVPRKTQAVKLADRHNTTNHQGAFHVLTPRGDGS